MSVARCLASLVAGVGLASMSAGAAFSADPLPSAAFGSVAPVANASQGLTVAGYVASWGGWRWLVSSDDPDDNSHLAFGVGGAISVPFGANMSVQLEGGYERYRDPGSEASLGALVAGGHVSWRNPDRFLVGLFGAAARPFADTIDDDSPGFYSGLGFMVGAEAQAYFARTTLYVQAGFADIRVDDDGGPEGFVSGWFGAAELRYFLNDDAMLVAGFGFGYTACFIDGDCWPSEDAGVAANWELKGTFRIVQAAPVYLTLGYRGGLYVATEDGDMGREHILLAGITVPFGAGSLFDNDRRGATLTLPFLPVRDAAWVPGLD